MHSAIWCPVLLSVIAVQALAVDAESDLEVMSVNKAGMMRRETKAGVHLHQHENEEHDPHHKAHHKEHGAHHSKHEKGSKTEHKGAAQEAPKSAGASNAKDAEASTKVESKAPMPKADAKDAAKADAKEGAKAADKDGGHKKTEPESAVQTAAQPAEEDTRGQLKIVAEDTDKEHLKPAAAAEVSDFDSLGLTESTFDPDAAYKAHVMAKGDAFRMRVIGPSGKELCVSETHGGYSVQAVKCKQHHFGGKDYGQQWYWQGNQLKNLVNEQRCLGVSLHNDGKSVLAMYDCQLDPEDPFDDTTLWEIDKHGKLMSKHNKNCMALDEEDYDRNAQVMSCEEE